MRFHIEERPLTRADFLHQAAMFTECRLLYLYPGPTGPHLYERCCATKFFMIFADNTRIHHFNVLCNIQPGRCHAHVLRAIGGIFRDISETSLRLSLGHFCWHTKKCMLKCNCPQLVKLYVFIKCTTSHSKVFSGNLDSQNIREGT